jgi:hypothetical protein
LTFGGPAYRFSLTRRETTVAAPPSGVTTTLTDSRRAPRSRLGRSFSLALPLIRLDVLATTRRPARATAVAVREPAHATSIRSAERRPTERRTLTDGPSGPVLSAPARSLPWRSAASRRGTGNPTPQVSSPPARRLLAACDADPGKGSIDVAMTAMNYIESDVPDGMFLAEWRRERAARRRRVRRTPRLRLRLA